MKKLILFLLLTVAGYGQVSTGTETYFDYGIQVAPASLQVPTTVNWIGTVGTDGTQGRVLPQNITIPQIPLNYSVLTPTIGGHLAGIDIAIGTKALDSNVIHKTGDETKTGILTLSDQLILGEVSGSPQELWKLPANSLLKYNNLQTNQYGFNITTAGADNFFWVNDEGSSRQCMLYADGDSSGTDSDIFGLSASQDSGVSYVKNFSVTQGGDVYVRKLLNINNATASTIASFDASKNLVSLSTATYPSLTELSYVKGVTSSLQTQLNTKISGSASNGQVSFWSGTNVQSGDNGLFWDNTNKRLGIGTTTPQGKLDVNVGAAQIIDLVNQGIGTVSFTNASGGTSTPSIVGKSTNNRGLYLIGATQDNNGNGDIDFNVRLNTPAIGGDFTTLTTPAFRFTRGSVPIDLMTILRNGNVGINIVPTTTATDKLQVNGNITANAGTTATHVVVKSQLDLKADLANPVFTGVPTAPTATAGTNTTQIATTAFVTGAIATAKPYKVYTAILTQTGTSAPTVIVLENTLGGTPVWSRIGPGVYSGLLSGFFTANKTTVIFTKQYTVPTGGTDIFTAAGCGSINSIDLSTANTAGLVDGVLSKATIEVRVYN